MRRAGVVAAIVGFLGAVTARGDPPAPAPARAAAAEPSPDDVIAAARAGDTARVAALVAAAGEDAFLLLDGVKAKRDAVALRAFVAAAVGPEAAALRAYAERPEAAGGDARRARVVALTTPFDARDTAAVERLLADAPTDGDDVAAVMIAFVRGSVAASARRWDDATSAFDVAVARADAIGWASRAARSATQAAEARFHRGDFGAARDRWAAAVERWRAVGDEHERRRALGSLAVARQNLGDLAAAAEAAKDALAAATAAGDVAQRVQFTANLAAIQRQRGDPGRALELLAEALRLGEPLGDLGSTAKTWALLGLAHADLGEYARSLDATERALRLREQVGDRLGAAQSRGNLAILRANFGDYEAAIEELARVREEFERMGNAPLAARTRFSEAEMFARLDDAPAAEASARAALAALERAGDRRTTARARVVLGTALGAGLRWDEAVAEATAAVEVLDATGDRLGAATGRLELALFERHRGRLDAAEALLERVRREAERLRAEPMLASALDGLANLRLAQRRYEPALELARRAVAVVQRQATGHGLADGAGLRARRAQVYDAGFLAAVALDDAASAFEFAESARAGALREAIGGRRALDWVDVPAELRRAESVARYELGRAAAARTAAAAADDLPALRERQREVEAKEAALRSAEAAVVRAAKAAGAVLYPTSASVEEVTAALDARTALVLYVLPERGTAGAVVVTREGPRRVVLGPSADLATACADFDPEAADAPAALERLRAALVTPLALPPAVTRVLVSPDGPTVLAPLPPLFSTAETPRDVAFVPSASAWLMLAEDGARRGSGVLALGDPAYPLPRAGGAAPAPPPARGATRAAAPRTLARLPGTKAEVEAVGDVRLLGPDATPARLFAALPTRPRWRSVHFACHGLLDTRRPFESALALTPTEDDDGRLVAHDLLRRQVPADLVVLSACETARGRVERGEGLLGLTTAFVVAGAPRLVASLWKVDDEATRVLMTRFYARMAAGAPTATALREAQADVRTDPRYAAPRAWAAWVLWGLAD